MLLEKLVYINKFKLDNKNKMYRYFSRFLRLNFGPGCRFQPTCSRYTKEAVEKYGLTKGLFLGLKRFLRCNPFMKGGYDPVI